MWALPLWVFLLLPLRPSILVAIEYHILFTITTTIIVLFIVLETFPSLIGARNILIELIFIDIFDYLVSFCIDVTFFNTASVHHFPRRWLSIIIVIIFQWLCHSINDETWILRFIRNLCSSTLRFRLNVILMLFWNRVDDLRGINVRLGANRTYRANYFCVWANRRWSFSSHSIEYSMSSLNLAALINLAIRLLLLKWRIILSCHYGAVLRLLLFGKGFFWCDILSVGDFNHSFRFLFFWLLFELNF